MTTRKKIVVLSLLITLGILLVSCNIKNTTLETEILEAPKASNILVNQSLSESILTGKFYTEGTLRFADPAKNFPTVGEHTVEWEFIPKDTTTYRIRTGVVIVCVYKYKLSFEESGGQRVWVQDNGVLRGTGGEMEDIFFNGSYTLDEETYSISYGGENLRDIKMGLVVAKNEYRFDGWSKVDSDANLIEFPITFSENTNLYAQYRFHTAEKLVYDYGTVSAKYKNEQQLNAAINATVPYNNSISGEIVIADMFNDHIITTVGKFAGTNISGFVYNNYSQNSGDFNGCAELKQIDFAPTVKSIGNFSFSGLTQVFIPNSAENIGYFSDCTNLERVEYENAEKIAYSWENVGRFSNCPNLKEVILRRIDAIAPVMFENSGIERIVLPETVEIIMPMAFKDCAYLQKVVLISDKLSVIDEYAFSGCKSFEKIVFNGDKLSGVGQYAFSGCDSLQEISFPSKAWIDPLAFYGTPVQKINITDEQIQWIANALHRMHIGNVDKFSGKLIVNCVRDSQYVDMNFEAEYVATTETINLYFDDFSIFILDALTHEFFHYYQYILCYGIGEKTFETVLHVGGIKDGTPLYDDDYPEFNPNNGIMLSASINPTIVFIIERGYPPTFGNNMYPLWITYDEMLEYLVGSEWVGYAHYGLWQLIDETELDLWKQPYIPLLPDLSNWHAYWSQPFEVAARYVASRFSGISYE
jgi:hypothetical protein